MTDVLARFRIDGRVAIVTGGARGLGAAAARALAAAGARVVVTSRDEATAITAADDLARAAGVATLGIAVDVRDAAAITAMVEQTRSVFGQIDILVNYAGTTRREPLTSLTEVQWDEVVDTNLKGTWLCCRAVEPVMRAARRGRIINVSSMLGQVGLPDRSPYIAS